MKTLRRSFNTFCLAAIALALTSATARAELGHVGFDTGFHTQSDVTAFALVLDAGVRPMDNLEVGLTAPFAVGSVDKFPLLWGISTGSEAGSATGNIMLGAAYVVGDSAATHSRIGLDVGLPLSRADDALADVVVLGMAVATYGLRNFWWYATDYVPVVVSGEVETATGPLFLLTDAAVGVLFPVRDRADDNAGTDALLQLRGGAAFGSELINAGVKLGFAHYAGDGSDDDSTQLALEPFVRMSELGPLYGELSLTMNLDKPLGFAFDDQRVWGLHLGLGARF